jgi:hypothetical protein
MDGQLPSPLPLLLVKRRGMVATYPTFSAHKSDIYIVDS